MGIEKNSTMTLQSLRDVAYSWKNFYDVPMYWQYFKAFLDFNIMDRVRLIETFFMTNKKLTISIVIFNYGDLA